MNKKTKIMAAIAAAIIVIGQIAGLLYWRVNLMLSIDTSISYVVGEADLTDFVNYSVIFETFVLGAVFAFLGGVFGAGVDIVLFAVYGIVRGIISFVGYLRYLSGKADEKYLAKKKKHLVSNDSARDEKTETDSK